MAVVYDVAFPWVKGGGEKRLADVLPHLSRAGVDVHLYSMKFWSGPSILQRDGYTLHGICPAIPVYAPSGRRSIKQALYFGLACLRLAFEPFDTIDCCGFPFFSLVACAFVAKIRRKRLVSTWLEVWGDAYWKAYLGRLGAIGAGVERFCAHLPERIVSISELTTSRLVALLHVSPQRIATIPIGVDLEAIDAEPADADPYDIVYVGRLMAFKNVDLVVRAVALLRDAGRIVRFRIVGDGPEMPSLRLLVRELSLEDRVRFEGFVAHHPYGMMKSARAFVHASSREGFGIVAIEAMACGLPIVTVDEPENAVRMLLDDRTGVVTAATPQALARAVGEVLDAPQPWAPACRASAARYDWHRIARDLLAEYASDAA